MLGIREIVIPGVSWVVGDGQTTRFWADKWLMNSPLREDIIGPGPVGLEEARVCDLWQHGR